MSKKEYHHSIQVRTRYGETDQMGFVYYGRFAEFYEIGRVETIRALGLSYKDLEDQDNIIMPVVSMQIRYLRPALYDELLDIKTILRHVPEDVITFFTEIRNEKKQLINAATIRLCFLDGVTKKRVNCPDTLKQTIANAIETADHRKD